MTRNPTWQCVVAAALARADGRWLMHLRPPRKRHGGLWEFPGGKVETDETPEIAIVRELNEELGIAVSTTDLAPACFAEDGCRDGNSGLVILLYTTRVWRGEPVAREAGAQIGWFLPAEIAGLAKPPLDVALATGLFNFGCAYEGRG